jgi:hypothetical protein
MSFTALHFEGAVAVAHERAEGAAGAVSGQENPASLAGSWPMFDTFSSG